MGMRTQAPTANGSGQLRVLLWLPLGFTKYWGPGISAGRLFFAKANVGVPIDVSVAHGDVACRLEPLCAGQYLVSPMKALGVWESIVWILRSVCWIVRNARRFDCAYVPGNGVTSVIPSVILEFCGVRVVMKLGNCPSAFSNASRLSKVLGVARLKRAALRRVSGVQAMTPQIQAEGERLGVAPDRILTIPNGVNTDVFRPARLEERRQARQLLGLPGDTFTVVCVGELGRRKNQLLLAQAARRIAMEGTEICLLLVGPVKDPLDCSDIMASRAPGLTLVHVPFMAAPELAYWASDLFVLVSANEGMANAMLEALACGLPIITSAASGADQIVVDGVNGRIVSPCLTTLTDAMRAYAQQLSLRRLHGQQSRGLACSRYSGRVVLRRLVECMSALCGRGRG